MSEHDEALQKINETAKRKAEFEKLKPITFSEFEVVVKKWMLLSDPFVLGTLLFHFVANKIAGDPIWVMLIGPSGGGKSELVTMFNDWPDYYALSTLTPQTLVSGFQSKVDVSLLPKLDKKILSIKDFTTIMTMQKDARFEVLSQLRETYDGQLTKNFGNGKVVNWKGKVGLIAAATEAYDSFAAQSSLMGERFIVYRLITGNRKDTSRASIENAPNQVTMRTELRNAAYALLKGIELDFVVPPIPKDIVERVVNIADFACLSRSSVIRDSGMRKEIVFVPSPEMPTRLAQQLIKLIMAAHIVRRGDPLENDLKGIYKIALDSIPKTNRLVMHELTKNNNLTTAEVAMALGYPTSTVHSFLEDISMKGLCLRVRGADSEEGGNADRWTLKQEYRDLLTEYDKIEQHVLTKEEELKNLAVSFGGEILV